jgi:hypothetical protein
MIVTLSSLRVVVHLYYPPCSWIHEALTRGLPFPARSINTRTVSPTLEENASDNQEAIDDQVYHQNNCCMHCKQDASHDQTEHAVSDEHSSKQLCLPLRLDDHGSTVCYNFAHHVADF